jgi:hypothetical protein
MEWETCFLAKFSSLGLPFEYHIFFGWSLIFGSYWLIVTWCIVLLLHPLPSVLLGLFVPPVFSVSCLRHELWGGVSMYLDPLRYSRPSLFSSSLYHHV